MTESSNTTGNINAQNTSSTDFKELKMQFLKDFVCSKNENSFRELFNTLSSDQNKVRIPDVLNRELSLFKSRSGNEKYEKVNTGELEFYELYRIVLESGGMELQTSQNNLIRLYKDLYKNDSISDFESIVKNAIEKETAITIKKLLSSELERDKYIKRVFPQNPPSLKSKEKVFEGIVVTGLNTEEESALGAFINDGIYSELLYKVVKKMQPQQKKVLLQRFFPVVTLAEAEKLGILTENQIKEKQKAKIKEVLSNRGIPQNQIDLIKDEEFNLVDRKEVLISTQEILDGFNFDPNLNEAVNKLLDEKKIKYLFREIQKQVTEGEENNKIENRETFFIRLKELEGKITGLGLLKNEVVGSHFHGSLKDEYGIEKQLYLEFVSFQDKGLNVRERTHSHGILKEGSGDIQVITYDNLFNILNYFPRGEVITKDDLKTQIESGEIKQFEAPGNIKTLDELAIQLDAIDEQGKHIKVAEGMTFEFKCDDPEKVGIGKLTRVRDDGIEVQSSGAPSYMTFNQFFSAFSEGGGKRLTNIQGFDTVIDSLKRHPDTEKKFGEIVWDNGKILPKNQQAETHHPGIKFFIKDKKALKLEEIKNNCVEVVVGEWEEKQEGDKKIRSLKKGEKVTMSFEILYAYLVKHKLEPFINPDDIQVHGEPNQGKLKKSWSPSKMFFGMQNILTLQAGFKQYIDSIKATLKDNNDLQAAQFALSLGKTLPASMKQDLQNRVEGVQKKKMNEKVDQLSSMNLGMGVDHALKILKTKNAYQHELEAALVYVLKKHGNLYPLKLYEYKNEFIWYEAMGGKKGDKMYQDFERDCARDNLQMTEEGLVLKLLGEQSNVNSPYYPKRRSTLVGEIGGAFSSGRNDSIDAGEKEASSYATQDGRKKLSIKMFKDGRHMFAFGAMKSMLDKGGSITDKSMVPFMVVMSGIPKRWHQDAAGKFKSLAFKHQMPICFFAANPQSVDLFERVSLKMAKQVSDSAYKDLLEISEMKKEGGKTEAEILGKLEAFWGKYGSSMAPKLETIDFNAVLESKTDADIKEYFGVAGGVAGEDDFKAENVSNGFYQHDNSFLVFAGGKKYLSRGLGQINRNGYSRDQGQVIADSLINRAKEIKNFKHYSGDEKKTQDGRKALFVELNKIIAKTFISRDIKNIKHSPIYIELSKLGFWLPTEEDKILNLTDKDMDSVDFERKLEKAFAIFEKGGKENEIEKSRKEVAIKIRNIMNNKTPPKRKPRRRLVTEESYDDDESMEYFD